MTNADTYATVLPNPTPNRPQPALATPADYERVGIAWNAPGALFRDWMGLLTEDTARDLPVVLSSPKRLAGTVALNNRVHARFRRRYRLTRPLDLAATAPDWPGMADDEPVETSIGRWEPGR